jgi:hypothetical protein
MSSEYEKLLNALPRPDLYDSWELVKRHMPVEQPPSAASYIVFQKGGQCYAKNGTTGHIEFGPGDASTVIQSALNALTPDRTWKEKVILKGSFTLTKKLNIPSYTVLEIQGKLALGNNVNDHMLSLSSMSDVDILFGELDGNRAGQSLYADCILLTATSRVKIENLKVHSAYGQGIDVLNNNSNIVLSKIESYDNGADGIAVNNNTGRIAISNALLHDNAKVDSGGAGTWITQSPNTVLSNVEAWNNAYGLRVESYAGLSEKVAWDNVIAHDNTVRNIYLNTVSGQPQARLIKIRGMSYNSAQHGVELYNVTDIALDIISHNDAYDGIFLHTCNRINLKALVRESGRQGIELYNSNNNRIEATIYKAGMETSNLYDAFRLVGSSSFNQLVAPIVDGADQTAFAVGEFDSGDYNQVIGGSFANVARSPPVNKVGAHTRFFHVYGYVTENSGTATFSGNGSQTTFTIAHGLAGTPKSWRVEAGSAAAEGDKYVTADATNLTVTFATAPPAGTNNVVLVWSAEM